MDSKEDIDFSKTEEELTIGNVEDGPDLFDPNYHLIFLLFRKGCLKYQLEILALIDNGLCQKTS